MERAPLNPLGRIGHFTADEKGRFVMTKQLHNAEGEVIRRFSPVVLKLQGDQSVVILIPWGARGISNHTLSKLNPRAQMWDDIVIAENQCRLLLRREVREQIDFLPGEVAVVEAWKNFFLLYNLRFESAVAEERESIAKLADFLLEEKAEESVPPDPAQEKMQQILRIAANIAKETGQRVKVTVEFEK